jgi:hypothetical protein
MRAARVQPLAGLREKRLEGRRPPARTGYALGTTVTIYIFESASISGVESSHNR